MIVVTGGAGFIGSNLVHALNAQGRDDVVVVDDLSRAEKFENLRGARIHDYIDKRDFLERIGGRSGPMPDVEAVLHQGACSSTTEPDGAYVIENNYAYSREVLGFCLENLVPLVYASSAAVYGSGPGFEELPAHEHPLNVYGFSKLLFDQHVRRSLAGARSQVVGLRYFNVYGPRERHKGPMASVVGRFDDQLRGGGAIEVFGAAEGREAGQHSRDFVWIGDVVDVVLWFLEHPDRSGIFNCGTGTARTFEDVANAVCKLRGFGELVNVPFPEQLRGRYQSFTQADLSRLRAAGYDGSFLDLETGVSRYLSARGPRPSDPWSSSSEPIP